MCDPQQKYKITESDGSTRTIYLNGRNAWCLEQLIAAGQSGISTRDNPEQRLGVIVLGLKKRYGFKIEAIKELRRGIYNKHHTQYILISKVKLIDECEVI